MAGLLSGRVSLTRRVSLAGTSCCCARTGRGIVQREQAWVQRLVSRVMVLSCPVLQGLQRTQLPACSSSRMVALTCRTRHPFAWRLGLWPDALSVGCWTWDFHTLIVSFAHTSAGLQRCPSPAMMTGMEACAGVLYHVNGLLHCHR